MKNIVVNLIVICFLVGCGAKEAEKENLNKLVGEWKITTEETLTLNAEIGQASSAIEEEINRETLENEKMPNSQEKFINCKNELNSLQNNVTKFVENWTASSQDLDQLTNQQQMGNWGEADSKQLRALELEIRQAEVAIAQWRNKLEELNTNCQPMEGNPKDSIN